MEKGEANENIWFQFIVKFEIQNLAQADSYTDPPYPGSVFDYGGSMCSSDEVFCIWKAFGRNTRDLGSFREETDKTTDLHQHCLRISPQKLETTSQITRDAVTTISKMASQDLKTASGLSPQPQALRITFEALIRDYMAAHFERMEIFENAIFKQREEINDRMTKMFRLLKELTINKAPEKILIREEAQFPVTKNINSISLARGEEERNDKTEEILNNSEKPTVTETEIPVTKAEMSNETKINRKNDPQKKITKKEDIEGNFAIPCSIGGLKHVNAFVDQGFNVNVMPYSTYVKLTDERPTKIDIRLSLASHSYIYPFGIAEDVLVEVAEHVYPVDFVILDIKEKEKRLFILGTPFLTTVKATIKFDKGTITLRSGKSKASPGMGRKDKALLGKGYEVQPMEEQKF
ncbi:MAK10-like protein [Tanacetum coccineum]|uniref:MAK10-like protein n=1 Tax=Tanacetum coccineum TaxID=301880 RepID=A0ABQ5E978_9ASTR